MIPVFIAPAYNRDDLLIKMLNSVDVPVERGLVLDNGFTGCHAAPNPMFKDFRVITPPYSSLGYGGSINFGVTQTAESPWWMWASNDLEFGPGDLAVIADYMQTDQPRFVTYGFTYGAINRQAWNLIGPVDEWSFFPIYFDDNDYHRRCALAGVEQVNYLGGIVHGDGGKGSQTIRSDPKAMSGNHRSFGENQQRYIHKWGGPPGHERFDTPWNSGLPLWFTRPDLDGRARRQW